MRRAVMTGLALASVLSATLCSPVWAQTPQGPSTDVRIDTKQKRTIVKPPMETGTAAGEAEAAAQKLEEQRRAEELLRKAGPSASPPLDESVVEGSKGRELQKQLK